MRSRGYHQSCKVFHFGGAEEISALALAVPANELHGGDKIGPGAAAQVIVELWLAAAVDLA
jgi:hypothetical protein